VVSEETKGCGDVVNVSVEGRLSPTRVGEGGLDR
jgi:hypothetical protein